LHQLQIWGGPVGGIFVLGMGYILVGKHRRLILDEILAGVALLIWIVVDRVNDSLFGGANPDLLKIWSVRGGLLAVLIIAYAIARKQWQRRAGNGLIRRGLVRRWRASRNRVCDRGSAAGSSLVGGLWRRSRQRQRPGKENI